MEAEKTEKGEEVVVEDEAEWAAIEEAYRVAASRSLQVSTERKRPAPSPQGTMDGFVVRKRAALSSPSSSSSSRSRSEADEEDEEAELGHAGQTDEPSDLEPRGVELVIDDDQGSVVTYERSFLTAEESRSLFEALRAAEGPCRWSRDVITIYGRQVSSPRLVCSFGDEGTTYRYAGVTRRSEGWPDCLVELKRKVAQRAGHPFNYVLVNLYQDGDDYMGWHSDKEGDLVAGSAIASVSLGAKRLFQLRNERTKEVKNVWLDGGSLLMMKGNTQKHYKHTVPKSRTITGSRINLTFRLIKHKT